VKVVYAAEINVEVADLASATKSAEELILADNVEKVS